MTAFTFSAYRFWSLRSLLTNIGAVTFVMLVPGLAHLTGLPVYFIEPMRLMLVMSVLFSHKANAYLMAVALPLVSFLVSGHPEPMKMGIIMAELLLNTWLFYTLAAKTNKTFISMFAAIVGSKLFCYAMYLIVFSWAFVQSEAGMLFLSVQLMLALALSAVTALLVRNADV